MSIKGYQNQKKEIIQLPGFTEAQSQNTSQFITAQQNSSDKVGLDVVQNGYFRLHPTAKTANANTVEPKRVLVDTTHGGSKGDIVRFELASANPYFESTILSVPDANTIILSAVLPNDIVTGDEFFILRSVAQRNDDTGAGIVTVTPSPIEFVLDGIDTEVSKDTGTPANSRPLPTELLNPNGTQTDLSSLVGIKTEAAPANDTASSGLNGRLQRIAQRLSSLILQLPATIGQKLMAASLSVTIASDQSPISIANVVNANGTIVNQALTATTAFASNVPANAVGFILEAPSDNTNNIRWCVGGTASATVGMLAEPGRDSGYVPCAANISICATVSGTNAFSIQWILSV